MFMFHLTGEWTIGKEIWAYYVEAQTAYKMRNLRVSHLIMLHVCREMDTGTGPTRHQEDGFRNPVCLFCFGFLNFDRDTFNGHVYFFIFIHILE